MRIVKISGSGKRCPPRFSGGGACRAAGRSAGEREVAVLAAVASRLPVVSEERVRRIRERIKAGTYHPDADKVARAILEFEEEIGS